MRGKHIVVGITGGIAVYKSADLVSRLVQAGADVHVVMTKAATEFMTPLTFRELTGNAVVTDMFAEPRQMNVQHVSLARLADLVIIAPATANIIGKMAAGIADDMLSTMLLATTAPVLVAPAMNHRMWSHPVVRENVAKLKRLGYHFAGPGYGYLACGEEGWGRYIGTDAVMAEAERLLFEVGISPVLEGKKVLVTAGPTREPLDPVRYLSNRSSGKMGYALARMARVYGAEVILITGPTSLTPPSGVEVISVRTAEEMYDAVLARFAQTDVVIKAAAVADFKPRRMAAQKLKKEDIGEGETGLQLELERTKDILAELGRQKTHQLLVGFAAETDNLLDYARRKLHQKNLDMIVANDVTEAGAGFDVDTNKVTLIYRDGKLETLPQMSKEEVARVILERVVALLE